MTFPQKEFQATPSEGIAIIRDNNSMCVIVPKDLVGQDVEVEDSDNDDADPV